MSLRNIFVSLSATTALLGTPPTETLKPLYADHVETIYDIREVASLKPSEHKIGGSAQVNLFPVPQDGAVGTNSLKKAITLFTFQKGGMRSRDFFRNAVPGMSPSGQYTPLFSKEMPSVME